MGLKIEGDRQKRTVRITVDGIDRELPVKNVKLFLALDGARRIETVLRRAVDQAGG
jgi:hypothetical protein